MEKQVSTTSARQGRRGVTILILMIVSLALALIVWFFVEIYGEAIAPEGAAPGMPAEGVTDNPDALPLVDEAVEIQPPEPAIEDPAQAPDASTTEETSDQAPGGNTGQQEPTADDSESLGQQEPATDESGGASDALTVPANGN